MHRSFGRVLTNLTVMSWRGGSNKRGYGGRRDRPTSQEVWSNTSQTRPSTSHYGPRRSNHPSGLKGREIGMFYAQRSQAKKKEQDMRDRGEIDINQSYVEYLETLVTDVPGNVVDEDQILDFQPVSDPVKWWKAGSGRDAQKDDEYLDELVGLRKDAGYSRLEKFRHKLPTWDKQEEIVRVVESNRVTVISGETGCGKTTQVPQFILDHYIRNGQGSSCRVVCTQPRRISAITVAERVAQERGTRCGAQNSSVGYQIRLESRFPRENGSILFCTTGIVLKWLESNPNLEHVSHLVLDEIHERDLLSDFLMIVLKNVLSENPRIRLVLMSATLNAEQFSRYYNRAAMIHVPGFTYPVEEFYMEGIVDWLRYKPAKQKKPVPLRKQRLNLGKSREELLNEERDFEAYLRHMAETYNSETVETLKNMDYEEIDLDLICRLIEKICLEKAEGAILVFLPGWEQISAVHKQLQAQRLFQSRHLLLPLHSMIPTVDQKKVFDRPPPGVRKIVLATNIAETSITIDDVVYVIDCGKIKMKNYDSKLNIATLQPEWNSLANSRQRRGRAGRVQPGECYHLYTSYHDTKLYSYQKPEILRTRLEELCLQIKLLNLGGIKQFVMQAMDTPDERTLEKSISLLKELNALTEDEELTPLGHHLARLPVDPHAGKMILFGAMFSCLDPITTIAASLSFKDAFTIPLGHESDANRRRRELSRGSKSDHILLVNAFQGWENAKRFGNESQYCWNNYLSQSTLRMLANMKSQFTDLLYDSGFVVSRDPKHPSSNIHSNNVSLVKAIVCAGLYPNVAKICTKQKKRGPVHKLTTSGGQKAKLHRKSVNVEEPELDSQWLVYHLMMKTKGINIFDSTPVSPFALLFFGGDINYTVEDGDECVSVDRWIMFKCERRVAELVRDLRRKLDAILSDKIRSPGTLVWTKDSDEGRVMTAIQDLITGDYYGYSSQNCQQRYLMKEN